MTAMLIAIVLVMVLAHLAPDLTRLRRYDWFGSWLGWLSTGIAKAHWPHPAMLLASLGLPLLLVAVVQTILAEPLHGLLALAFSVAALFYAWGPRDLDQDIDQIAAATRAEQPTLITAKLAAPFEIHATPGAEATVAIASHAVLRRWFGPLFWFVVLGPLGAIGYRLTQLAAEDAASWLSPGQHEVAVRLLAILNWPTVQLMTLGMAIATDFDNVWRAWRSRTTAAGGVFTLDRDLLPAVTAAAVRTDLSEVGETELLDDPNQLDRVVLLRDVQSLAWRVLIVWLTVIALVALTSLLT